MHTKNAQTDLSSTIRLTMWWPSCRPLQAVSRISKAASRPRTSTTLTGRPSACLLSARAPMMMRPRGSSSNTTATTSSPETLARQVEQLVAQREGTSRKSLEELLSRLAVSEREKMAQWLREQPSSVSPSLSTSATAMTAVEEPTRQQLQRVAFVTAVPFVGFGFMDNLVSIHQCASFTFLE